MKILYIDIAASINEIRVAERVLFTKELPQLGYNVQFLLKSNKSFHLFFKYSNILLSRFTLNIPLLLSLRKILKHHSFDLIISRNYSCISFIPLMICLYKKIPFGFIKAFPLTEYYFLESKINANPLLKVAYFVKAISNLFSEKIIFNNSSIIIARSDTFLKYLKVRYNISDNRLISIPMGYDSSYLEHLMPYKVQEKYKIPKST